MTLLLTFSGGVPSISIWISQIYVVMDVYGVDENLMKVVVISKLQGRAIDWFHSKPSHIPFG